MSEKQYLLRKDNGLCIDCGKPLDGLYVRCSACNEKNNRRNRERTRMLLSYKRCIRCGATVQKGRARCFNCLRYNAEAEAKRRQRKLEAIV